MHPPNRGQYEALIAVAKALKIAFETDRKSPYDPEFVAKVLAGEKAKNEGEPGLRVDGENLWK
jgi:hypothetical protein